jgi:hypothetical protein
MDIFPIFSVGLGLEKAPEGVSFAKELFKENKDILKGRSSEPNHLTTLFGYKRNTVIVNHKETDNLKKFKELVYRNAFKFFSQCGYDTIENDIEVTNLWLNEMKPGGNHKKHSHYGYQISGCFYVDVPKNAGDIVFTSHEDNKPLGATSVREYTVYNSTTWRISPEAGDMYFWRSDLEHQVLDGKFAGVRRSIAFDISVIDRLN